MSELIYHALRNIDYWKCQITRIGDNIMKNIQNDKNKTKESIRKPLPQSSIVGKRKEIFNLNTTKEKNRENN